MQERDIIAYIEKNLDKKRFEHSLLVTDTAEKIARYIDAEIQMEVTIKKVRQAALLHDYAKNLNEDELYSIAESIKEEWAIDSEELSIPQVLHAPVSAYLARERLGIVEYDVLEAIRYHTIGSPDMGIIGRIIFVADFIEPGRKYTAAEEVRKDFSLNGLNSAIIMICNYNLKYNIETGRQIHPNTLLLRNAYLRRQT